MLSIKNLYASYGSLPVLHNFSLEIYPGEFWAILGQNGSGKTSLLNCISGSLKPVSGTITIAGFTRPAQARRSQIIGRTHSAGSRPEWLTVREQTLLGRLPWLGWSGLYSAQDQEIADNALAETGLTELAERQIRTLSEGQWQMAALSRALAQITNQAPALLLLDEPAANLDLKRKISAFTLLRELCRKNIAILAALHDCSLAANFCSHMTGLKNGSQNFKGLTNEVLNEKYLSLLYDYPIGVIQLPNSGQNCVFARLASRDSSIQPECDL